jgi:hypothetical protein
LKTVARLQQMSVHVEPLSVLAARAALPALPRAALDALAREAVTVSVTFDYPAEGVPLGAEFIVTSGCGASSWAVCPDDPFPGDLAAFGAALHTGGDALLKVITGSRASADIVLKSGTVEFTYFRYIGGSFMHLCAPRAAAREALLRFVDHWGARTAVH